MNRWLSDSLGIESKAQLKSHRMDKFRGLLLDSGLDLALAAFWSAEERALEIRLWKLADQDYELEVLGRGLFLLLFLPLLVVTANKS